MDQYLKKQIEITDLSTEGHGIGRTGEGRVVATPYTLPGDNALVEVYELSKGILHGELIEVSTPSPARCPHPCAHYLEGCPASRLGAYSYNEALAWKRRNLSETLRRMGNIEIVVPPVVASPLQWGYRERIDLGIEASMEIMRVGYQTEQKLIPIRDCQLADSVVREMLRRFVGRITDPVELSLTSNLHGVKGTFGRILFRANGRGGVVVVLFLNADRENVAPALAKVLSDLELAGWEIRITDSLSARAYLSKVWRQEGNSAVTINWSGGSAAASALSFSQVNKGVAELIAFEISSHITPSTSVLDLYGGWGLFGMAAAAGGAEVLVVDVDEESIRTGESLALKAGLEVRFKRGDLNLASDWRDLPSNAEACIVDPPRRGLGGAAIQWLNRHGAAKLIYVSCHPAALARDVQALSSYRIDSVKPFDMFPQTPDLETVTVLVRNTPKARHSRAGGNPGMSL